MDESQNSLTSFIESEDVSEHAELIGLKFDQVIKEFHLDDKLNPLMKHVIYLLEQMDLMIKEKNELQASLCEVEGQLQQFRFESKESKLERIKCQNEFEQIEESFRNENTELLNLISKLKDDNLKLRNLLNKEQDDDGKFENDEKQFKQNIDGIENCTQSLLINEKKKAKSLQKELDLRNEMNDKIEKQLNQERKRIEALCKQVQRLKEENLILNQQIDYRHNEHEKQLELTRELKDILAATICDHLDEHQQLNASPVPGQPGEPKSKEEYIEKQRTHLAQLQLVQKLVETLSVAIEANTEETSKFDSIKFNDKLSEKLEQLEHEQRQQSNRLSSSLNNQNGTPVESPQFCSLESNCSLVNRKSPKHLLNEPPQSKFTLSEIRNILLERNSLQTYVKQLEKQLASFKKAQSAAKTNGDDSGASKDSQSIKKDNFSTENFKLLAAETKKDKKPTKENENSATKRKLNSPEPDCPPVQGPMPKEPDEKLFPNFRRNGSSSFLKFFPLLKINRNK